MTDWEEFLDKFLADTELAVLADSGSVSRQHALDWAHEQYKDFSGRHQQKEDERAEENYIEDLRNAAKLLDRKKNQ